MQGRQLITLWDIDPMCNRMRSQGRHASTPQNVRRHPGQKHHFGDDEDLKQASASTGPGTAVSSTRCSTTLPSSRTIVLPTMVEGVSALQLCKQAMKKKYGSTVAAWRASCDPEMTGSVSFGKLCLTLEDMMFQGNVKGLWKELTGNSAAFATFQDVDPAAQLVLNDARDQLVARYGCLTKAWKEGLDTSRLARLDEAVFTKTWEELGLPKNPGPKKVFKLLLARHGQRSITRD